MCACASSTLMVVKQKCAVMQSVALPKYAYEHGEITKETFYHRNLGRCNETYLNHRKWYSQY